MRILFLTNLIPYPLDNGGKIKTYSTLEALHNGGYDVDLLCFYEDDKLPKEWVDNVKQYCSKVDCIHTKLTTNGNMSYMLRQAFLSLFSSYSFGLYKYKNKEMSELIKERMSQSNYDIIYYDHLQLGVYHKNICAMNSSAKYILDEHNCEYMIMKRHYENASNILKKAFLNIEYKKLMRFEAKMLKAADKVLVLSNEDKLQLETASDREFLNAIIPISVGDHSIKDVSKKDSKKLRMLFLGTMTWEPNRSGLVWFMQNVIPKLEKQGVDYSLDIVGKNPDDEIKNLAKQHENINVAGYVESIEEYFEKCDVMVVPLFVGSGQRVKIIESFSRGFPVVSTTVGAEGLGYTDGENIFIADTDNEFIDKLVKIQDDNCYKVIAKKSRELYEENYSHDSIEKKILENIKSVFV